MSRIKLMNLFAPAVVGVTLLAAGCPQQNSILGGNLAGTTLSDFDQDAIAAALNAIESATTATNTTQDVTASNLPTARESTCPAVEFSASNTGGLSLAVAVDFGTGCQPATGNVSCSGSASGSLSALTSTLSLNFDTLSCDGKSLNGTVEFGFASASSSVNVTGDWDLTSTEGDSTVGLDVSGEASFDATTLTTTYLSVTGVIDDNGKTCSTVWDNLAASYFNNGNFIPQSGEMTLSGNAIKTMVVRFNAASPSTGDVEVSINGGAFFVYNLFEQE